MPLKNYKLIFNFKTCESLWNTKNKKLVHNKFNDISSTYNINILHQLWMSHSFKKNLFS